MMCQHTHKHTYAGKHVQEQEQQQEHQQHVCNFGAHILVAINKLNCQSRLESSRGTKAGIGIGLTAD